MPNFDAGHYFLTVVAPIRPGSILIGEQSHSHLHLIRQRLALMPTGEITVASRGKPVDNPFARTTRTHFARFVVLDDVVYNGRTSGDTLISEIRKINPLVPEKIDQLTTPFLIFAADFDAVGGDDGVLRDYLRTLWASMEKELKDIFEHCVGFKDVRTGDDFYSYIKKCQLETTMPFNDYWSTPPALTNFDFKPWLIGGGVAVLALIVGLFAGKGWLILLGLLAIVLVVAGVLFAIVDKGRKPFPISAPPAPGPDLPTVLKALTLQRDFTAFAIETQGQDDQALHAAFGDFLARTRPNDLETATQKPGIIGV